MYKKNSSFLFIYIGFEEYWVKPRIKNDFTEWIYSNQLWNTQDGSCNGMVTLTINLRHYID